MIEKIMDDIWAYWMMLFFRRVTRKYIKQDKRYKELKNVEVNDFMFIKLDDIDIDK